MPAEAYEQMIGTKTTGGYQTEVTSCLPHTYVNRSSGIQAAVEGENTVGPETLSWCREELLSGIADVTSSLQIVPEIYTRLGTPMETITGSILRSPMESTKFFIDCVRLSNVTWSPMVWAAASAALAGVELGQPTRLVGRAISESWSGAKSSIPRSSPSLPENVERHVREPHQEALDWIKSATGLSWEDIGDLLGVSHPTVLAWRKGSRSISRSHRQRLFAVREVLERARKRNPRQSELAAWLDMPRGADAKTPADLLKAGEVGRARLLAITTSSSKVKAPPEWAQRHMSEAYESSKERQEAVPPARDEDLLNLLDEDEEE